MPRRATSTSFRALDLAGQRVGMLTVVARIGVRDRKVIWSARCDCGQSIEMPASYFRQGYRKHCGCQTKRLPAVIPGARYGMLTVLGPAPPKREAAQWYVRCDCGVEKTAGAYHLKTGEVRSCGCNRGAHLISLCTKHGHAPSGAPSPEYRIWRGMRQRCTDPAMHNYQWYGGRGVTVCERWESFENFLADMGPKPSPQHTIDRVDVNGHYEPRNCRWATWAEQHQNTTTTAWIEIGGVRRTRREWAVLAGIRPQTLANRQRLGWTGERLILPLQQEGRRAKKG